jgi:hypothetical protein
MRKSWNEGEQERSDLRWSRPAESWRDVSIMKMAAAVKLCGPLKIGFCRDKKLRQLKERRLQLVRTRESRTWMPQTSFSRSTSRITASCDFQISLASCSTQPGCEKI